MTSHVPSRNRSLCHFQMLPQDMVQLPQRQSAYFLVEFFSAPPLLSGTRYQLVNLRIWMRLVTLPLAISCTTT